MNVLLREISFATVLGNRTKLKAHGLAFCQTGRKRAVDDLDDDSFEVAVTFSKVRLERLGGDEELLLVLVAERMAESNAN